MTRRSILVLGAAAALAACDPDLTVPNLNNPSVGGDATRSSVVATAQGLIGNVRGMSTGMVLTFGIWGRELYDLRPEEPRPYQDNLVGPRDRNSSGSGAAFNYGTLVEIRALLEALEGVANMSDQEKEGIRGWAKTIAGFAYSQTAMVYPEAGAPLRPPENPTGDLEPIATAEELYNEAVRLFDEAVVHLQNAGSSFVFGLTPGYDGFDTPQTFIQVNRALKARALKYRGDWAGVLTALQQSFIDASAPLDLGVYHSYFAADAAFNPFFSPTTQYLHPRFLDDAQQKADGTPDDRATAKTVAINAFTFRDVTVTEKPNIYRVNTTPFPWITNEELILIRAEARLASGDVAGAIADVNVIRTGAGGLAPVSGLGSSALLTEILYNKFYSLIYRGGWTYFDARQYNRLDGLPRAAASHVVFDRINWPASESIARNMTTGPCGGVEGF